MRRKHLVFASVPVLLILLAAGLIYAQGAEPRTGIAQSNGSGRQVALGDGFTYQGQLKDDGGNPVDDTCRFNFSLWDSENGGSQIGSNSTVVGVAVTGGYFAVVVNGGAEFGPDAFTGEERWLEIVVRCSADPAPVTLSPRQLLSAAPYAFSLQPGAVISGEVPSGLTVINNASGTTQALFGYASATTGYAKGVYGQSDSTQGRGVYGWAIATTGDTYGAYGESNSTQGTGVYGKASSTNGVTYGVYGQNSSTSGYGVCGYAVATSGETTGVVGRSDSPAGYGVFGWNTAGGWAGYFDGDVSITGAAVGFFPRPAYDSGWQYLAPGDSIYLTHNLGGDVEDYVVDLTCHMWPSDGVLGIHNTGVGGDDGGTNEMTGVRWSQLTNTDINVHRWPKDAACQDFRLRIWVYQ